MRPLCETGQKMCPYERALDFVLRTKEKEVWDTVLDYCWFADLNASDSISPDRSLENWRQD